VLPQSHPCAKRRAVALSELAADPFVMFPASVAPTLHKQVQSLFSEASFSPRISLIAHEWLTIIGLVESGAGVSLAPASFRRLKWGEVRYVPLSGTSHETSVTVCRADLPSSHPVDRFVEILRREAALSNTPQKPH
jgi:DNA-binding transcriptional LysR family regulator